MALPASPPITSEMIRLQYGGSLPFRLQDYYRGGLRVPNIAANNSIPTSGPISFLNFLGQGGSGGGLAVYAPNVNAFVTIPPAAAPSGSTTASASGGTSPYTYGFSLVSGGSGITMSGSGASRTFSAPSGSTDATFSGTYRVTVTDAASATAFYDFSVTLQRSTL